MRLFTATEFYAGDDPRPTGRTETYLAPNIRAAVRAVCYSRALDAPATVGPSGRVVYARDLVYVVTPARERRLP